MGAHRCVFCCWVCRIFCFSVIGMTASDILFSKDFLNFWQENSEGFLSNIQPGVKYHSILADFCCTRSTYCCSPFITPLFLISHREGWCFSAGRRRRSGCIETRLCGKGGRYRKESIYFQAGVKKSLCKSFSALHRGCWQFVEVEVSVWV